MAKIKGFLNKVAHEPIFHKKVLDVDQACKK